MDSKCVDCEKIFSSSSKLSNNEPHSSKMLNKCVECDKKLSQSINLRFQMMINSKPQLFKCYICKINFTQLGILTRHISNHINDINDTKVYTCSECGKTFSQSGNLKSHMTIHTGEKPFKCVECGKVFSLPSNLKKHMRIHTSEKPYKCVVCDKSYRDHNTLRKHKMRFHTGV